MNNFKRISAIILTFCSAVAVLNSCGNKDQITDANTTASVTAQGDAADNINEEYITSVVTNAEGKTVIQTIAQTVKNNNTVANEIEEFATEKQTVTVKVTDKKGNTSISVSERIVTVPTKAHATTVPTTKKAVVNDTVNEKAVGISMLSKSDPVQTGNYATVVIQGTPGKTYSIEFYESPSKLANYSALEEKTADANGFVSWSFKIQNSCDPGKRKVVVKENNSSNYMETSITVI